MTKVSLWIKIVPFLYLGLFGFLFGGQMLIYRQAETQVNLGLASYQQGNYANAEGRMRHALALNPNNAYASYYLGLCLLHDGNVSEARSRLKTAQSIADGSRFMARNEPLAEETSAALNRLGRQ